MIEIINIIKTVPIEIIYVAGVVYLLRTREIHNFALRICGKKPTIALPHVELNGKQGKAIEMIPAMAEKLNETSATLERLMEYHGVKSDKEERIVPRKPKQKK